MCLDTPDVSPPADPWLGEQVCRVAHLAGVERGELTVTIVDDATMTRLHEQYHDDASTTDALTFDLRERLADPLDGEVVICRDEAVRQSQARGHEARVELLLYAVHGLLHLLGEDDHTPEAGAQMHRREDELLTAAGVGAVYAREASAKPG